MSDIRWFVPSDEVEPEARAQVERTASMPFVARVAVMPDCHYGKGSTVGTVVGTVGAVMPACVGVDIGCGMIAVRTSYSPDAVRAKAADIRRGIERRIPVGIGQWGQNSRLLPSAEKRVRDLEFDAQDTFGDPKWMDRRSGAWREQLGSLGGGNHFIEVCVGKPSWYGVGGQHEEEVWVILHSGSRGVGNKTGTYWTKMAQSLCSKVELPDRDLAYLRMEDPEFDQYMRELFWCQRFALANREEMMDRVLDELHHSLGVPCGADWCGTVMPGGFEVERINCHHNYVSKEIHDYNHGDIAGFGTLLVTRKGAINADVGVRGLIPGSMGARSYIVTGLGNPESMCSAPHGAGRRMSRTKARKEFKLEQVAAELSARGIEARMREAIIDEAPGAYKDIDMVMQQASTLVRPTHVLSQIISVKGD